MTIAQEIICTVKISLKNHLLLIVVLVWRNL